jgi:hypothetical protein
LSETICAQRLLVFELTRQHNHNEERRIFALRGDYSARVPKSINNNEDVAYVDNDFGKIMRGINTRILVPTFVVMLPGFSCYPRQGIGGDLKQVPWTITISRSIPDMRNGFGETANTSTSTAEGSVAQARELLRTIAEDLSRDVRATGVTQSAWMRACFLHTASRAVIFGLSWV